VRDIADAAGRVIAVGIPGPALDATTTEALEAIGPGAVVLFRRNVETPEQLDALVDALHRLPSRPLVAIDHEGGSVSRFGPPFTAFPTAAELGRAGVDSARAVGEAIGRELASVGIDVDFAPVLDVGAGDAAFIGDRAFSSDARRVAELGLAFAAGLTAAGVLPCGKHFPGHGATATDSHHERPVVMRSRAEILERELVPFRAAVDAHVPMLLSGHVVYPALDPERIATLSPVIATTLLRHEIGFRGVLWSDDLSMRAVSDHLPIPDAAVAAIAAGVDGVLNVHDLEPGRRAKEQLLAAVESKALPAQRLREAADRIAAVSARRAAAPLALPCDAHAELAERVRVMAATQRA
jgi:beta-N-acetylhexosaminidase